MRAGEYNVAMECYRHKRVETNVRCGKCDKPICPKCMISGPAGMRCPDCASLRSTALYQIHPARLVLATVVALIVGTLGAFAVSMVNFFVIFVGPIYGGIVAEAVLRCSGRKRGPILEVIGVGSIVVGYLLVLLPTIIAMFVPTPVAAAPNPVAGAALAWGISGIVWHLIGAALAISTCYGRLKYS
jgi:hypothetical protein